MAKVLTQQLKELEDFSYRKSFNKQKLEQQFFFMHIFPITFYTFQGRSQLFDKL